MESTLLKWTKNIRREDGEWAYPRKDNISHSGKFELHWKPYSYKNATTAEKGDLAILRQKAKVTHIVQFIDNDEPHADPKNDNNWIYRWVKAIWMPDIDDWSELPHQNDVFNCSLHLQGGNIMKLENIKNLREKWNTQGGIAGFQKYIQQKFEL